MDDSQIDTCQSQPLICDSSEPLKSDSSESGDASDSSFKNSAASESEIIEEIQSSGILSRLLRY